jgi:hypothetical protein
MGLYEAVISDNSICFGTWAYRQRLQYGFTCWRLQQPERGTGPAVGNEQPANLYR